MTTPNARTTLAVLLAWALTGCGPRGPYHCWCGNFMYSLFPFDGTRTWEFTNLDAGITHRLVGTLDGSEPEEVDGVDVYTVVFRKDCDGADATCVDDEIVRTLRMSSDDMRGVQVHGYAQPGEFVFDPPLQITEARDVVVGDVHETTTAGFRWTSTLVDFEDCPVHLPNDGWTCAHFALADGDDDPTTHAGLAGGYWVAKSVGFAALELEGEPGMWHLSYVGCEGECDGRW